MISSSDVLPNLNSHLELHFVHVREDWRMGLGDVGSVYLCMTSLVLHYNEVLPPAYLKPAEWTTRLDFGLTKYTSN